jgi:hypothetical protein
LRTLLHPSKVTIPEIQMAGKQVDISQVQHTARHLFLSNKDLANIPSSVADVAGHLATLFTPELKPIIEQMNTKEASSISQLLLFLPIIMAAVEKVENMSNVDKKAAVMTALKAIVTTLCPQDAILLCLAIDTILAPAIDMACDAVQKLSMKLKSTGCFGLCGKSSSSTTTLEKSLKKQKSANKLATTTPQLVSSA